MITEKTLGFKGDINDEVNEVNLNDVRETRNSESELCFDLPKMENINVVLSDTLENIPVGSLQSREKDWNKSLMMTMESTAVNLLDSLQKMFCTKMILSSADSYANSSSLYGELLIMTLDLISNISNYYKQRLLESNENDSNEWEFYDKESNTITHLLHIIIVVVSLYSRNRTKSVEGKFKQIDYVDDDNFKQIVDRLNYLEHKLNLADKEILSLTEELERTKHELVLLSLSEKRGLPNIENNKLFKENIEATFYEKELETLQKSYLELESANMSLEHKVVNLLNEINCLVSKNVMLEERTKHLRKQNQEKIVTNSTKFLTKSDLLMQIKELKETINDMGSHNIQLNTLIADLRKDHKYSKQSYLTSRTINTERKIQNKKLENCLEDLKVINDQLLGKISAKDKRIEELEIEVYLSSRKIEELYVQLAASETLRLSHLTDLQYNIQLLKNINSTNKNDNDSNISLKQVKINTDTKQKNQQPSCSKDVNNEESNCDKVFEVNNLSMIVSHQIVKVPNFKEIGNETIKPDDVK